MRKGMLAGTVLVAVIAVFAVSRQMKNDKPCRKLTLACKAAGFKRGHSVQERKSFFESCMKPLMDTGELGGIRVDPEDAQACKEKWDSKRRNYDEG